MGNKRKSLSKLSTCRKRSAKVMNEVMRKRRCMGTEQNLGLGADDPLRVNSPTTDILETYIQHDQITVNAPVTDIPESSILHDQTTMAEIEWTNEQIISLVNEYKKRPVLWDCNDNTYRVQTAKYEAWSEMAEIFGCPITLLRKKLNSIFASHRREKGKVRAGTRSTWFLYEHLSFLPTHIENEGETSVTSTKRRRQTEEQTQSLDQTSEEYLEEEELIIKEEPQEPHQVIQEVYLSPRPEKLKGKSKPAQREKKLPVVEVSPVINTKDECDTFGEYIAMSLRKHDERTQAMIKQAINNILFEQEMKKYNTEQYTVVIANADENPLIEDDE